mgnify:CR=1 FL=1
MALAYYDSKNLLNGALRGLKEELFTYVTTVIDLGYKNQIIAKTNKEKLDNIIINLGKGAESNVQVSIVNAKEVYNISYKNTDLAMEILYKESEKIESEVKYRKANLLSKDGNQEISLDQKLVFDGQKLIKENKTLLTEPQKLEISEKIECIRYLENGMKIKLLETDFVGVGIDMPEDLEKAKTIFLVDGKLTEKEPVGEKSDILVPVNSDAGDDLEDDLEITLESLMEMEIKDIKALAKEKGKFKGGKPKFSENDPRLQLAFRLYLEGATEKDVERQTGINRRTFQRYRQKYDIHRK